MFKFFQKKESDKRRKEAAKGRREKRKGEKEIAVTSRKGTKEKRRN